MTANSPVRIGVAGALGRMGRAVVAVVEARPDAVLAAVFDRPGLTGAVGGLPLASAGQAIEACDVLIDFSTPDASVDLATACATHGGVALVSGATGLSPEQDAAITTAATRIALVRSGNYSLGVNLLAGLVERAAAVLEAGDWDIELFEAHHRRKVDAPSGTALMLGEAAARGRGVALSQVADRVRDGLTGPRESGHIGFSVMRGGGVVGEHSVSFIADDEIVTLSHSARDRSLFARGAMAAALWSVGRAPGLYDMMDVLGFTRR